MLFHKLYLDWHWISLFPFSFTQVLHSPCDGMLVGVKLKYKPKNEEEWDWDEHRDWDDDSKGHHG